MPNLLEKRTKFACIRGLMSLYDVLGTPVVGVVGLGEKDKLDAGVVRGAVSTAVRHLRQLDSKQDIRIELSDFGFPLEAAEGAMLATFSYDQFKKEKPGSLSILGSETTEWKKGIMMGEAQNMARLLMETPANHMNPTLFAEHAQKVFEGIPNVELIVRERSWVEKEKMGAFLSVSNGSKNDQPLKFLEIHYRNGGDEQPVALVGKGVTFDTGGISLKPSKGMAMMKGDMGGAACVLSAMWAIASLQIPKNVSCFIPLTENMPSGSATKPGDVIVARNGLSIEVDNTDAEGRLILADAIHYASSFQPKAIIELSTLTGAMDVALGSVYAGVFSNSDTLWHQLQIAGEKTGDRFWRMPLDEEYKKQISSTVADLKNVGDGSAGSCTAAIFLKEFIPKDSKIQFAHIGNVK
jgi:aminopeptidase